MTPRVDVVLPCLNEAAALPGVLARIPEERSYRPLVVDNGSTDDSARVAEEHGATVVREPCPGYGAAVHAGVLRSDAELVCVADADGSMDLSRLPELVDPLCAGTADLVVGRRVPVASGAFPWHARLGNAVLAAILRTRGVAVHDLAPLRACWRTDLLGLEIGDRGFGYPLELLIRAGRAGWRISEAAVDYYPRAAGTSKVTGSMRGTARAVRDMVRVLR